jgi:translocation and assembly module TamB
VIEHLRVVTPHGTVDGTVRVGWLPALDRKAHAERVRADLAPETISGSLRFESLELDRMWQARTPGSLPADWRARLNGTIDVSGTVGNPSAVARGRVEDLAVGKQAMGRIGLDVQLENGSLVIRELAVTSDEQTLHAEGNLPVQVDLTRRPEILRDRELSGRITLPRSSFTVLERFVNIFEPPPGNVPRGEIEAELTLSGTVAKPELRGGARVYGASFMLRDLEEVYRDVDATGTFGGGKLTFESMTGTSGGGKVTARKGEIEFAHWRVKDYEFVFDLDRFTVWSVPEMSASVSGQLTVRGEDVGGRDPIPNLRGTFDVHEAEITQEFTNNAENGPPLVDTDRPEWLCDVRLRAPKGRVWVRNSQIDAELAGNVDLVRSEEGLSTRGLATVRRGTYTLPFVRFEITRGELDFSRHPGLDPEFDVEAQTGRSGQRTYVTLTGSLSRPRLDFRSDRTELTSEQIQQELVSLSTEDLGGGIADLAEQTIRDLQLLEHFSIDPASRTTSERDEQGNPRSSGLASYNVSAGRALSDRVFLIYTQGVKSDIQQRVSLEVDINRWLLLESAYERRTITEAGPDQAQNAFDVNFKYRHEY